MKHLRIGLVLPFFTLFSLATLLSAGTLQGQTISEYNASKLKMAIDMYNKRLYVAADKIFEELYIKNIKDSDHKSSYMAQIAGYRTLCALSLGSENSEGVVAEFIEQYPASSELESIYLKLATIYFDKQDYVKSYDILKKIENKNFSIEDNLEFTFRYAYCNLRIGDLDKALRLFTDVTYYSNNRYSSPAAYYSAYIHYMKKDFTKAIEIFSSIIDDTRFANLASYYILESQFMLKNYEYVIANGENVYNSIDKEYKAKTARMLSESYFALNKNDEAKFYFEKFSIYSSDLSRKDIYYSGIIAYSLKNYNAAIDALQKVAKQSDSLGQNASYYLGNCYIKIKNKQQAMFHFKRAWESNYDITIKEDALFNYAKLSFDLNSDISVFDQYLKTYSPGTEKYNEIKSYIASSYIVKQDYKSAVDVLSQITNPSLRNIVFLQKASLLRAVQLAGLGAYRDALPYLDISLSNGGYNSQVERLARFWKGEVLFRDGNYEESIQINLSLASKNSGFRGSGEYPMVFFNLGYAYLKITDFPSSEQWFREYLNINERGRRLDNEVYARLGDCLFMQKRYDEAAAEFEKIDNSNEPLYIYGNFQRALAYGLNGKETTKADILRSLIREYPKSNVYPDLLFELGRTLVQIGDNSQAEVYFTELTNVYKSTHYYTKALLELGMISINRHNVEKAIEYYKLVVAEAPMSAEAQNAIAGLENIYQDTERVQEYLTYLDSIGLSTLKTPDEKELMLFNAAEKQFLNGNYQAAVSSLNTFIKTHPTGVKSAHAYYYLGESLAKINKPEAALDAFKNVMENGEGSFIELSTLRYAQISYELQKYRQAAGAYTSLERIAQLENNIIEARMGTINSLFMDKDYSRALEKSLSINTQGFSKEYLARTKYITAKSMFRIGQREKALPLLREIAKNTQTPEGAECSYLLIQNSFDNGDFATVEKLVFAFSDSKTPQKYWLAKSFILLGDSYAEREEWEQAKATYNSILESYKPEGQDDVAEQIKLRISKIKTE